MSHPTPWQLELHALGEHVPAVQGHLPCAVCQATLEELTADPGPVPVGILEGVGLGGPRVPGSPWMWGAAAAALVAAIGGGLLVPPVVDAIRTPPVEGQLAVNQEPDDDPEVRPVKKRPAAPAPAAPPGEPLDLPEPLADLPRPSQTWPIAPTGKGHACNPVWSRDGAHVAFEVNNYGDRSELYVLSDLHGDPAPVKLPGGGPFDSSSHVVVNPVWHPQGIVVFEGSNAGGQFRLYYFQPGGGAAAEMISLKEVPGDLVFPEIDPEGKALVFVADETGNGNLRLRDTATGRLQTLAETEATEMFPRFSPDGDRLLFTRKVGGSEDIFQRDVATGAERRLISGGNDQTRPEWTDAGVAFFDNSASASRWDLKVASGGASWTLATEVRLPLRARPAVGPDGEWVAYALDDPFQSGAMSFSRADGSQTVVIDVEGVAVGEPSVTRHDGRLLLAYTALPDSEADYRGLYVADVTEILL